jgi:hypothetical protein
LRATGPPMRLRHTPVRNPRPLNTGRARGASGCGRNRAWPWQAGVAATHLASVRSHFLNS